MLYLSHAQAQAGNISYRYSKVIKSHIALVDSKVYLANVTKILLSDKKHFFQNRS